MGLGLRYQGVLSSVEDKTEVNLSTIEDEITCRGRTVLDVRRKHHSEALLSVISWGLPGHGLGLRAAWMRCFREIGVLQPLVCAVSRDKGAKSGPLRGDGLGGGCLRFAKCLVDQASISSPEIAVSQAPISPGASAAGEPPKCGNIS